MKTLNETGVADSPAALPVVACSAWLGESVASLLKSAEAWAAEGLRESKLAGDAARNQNHCTAENHRKNAALAFECELNLRKLTISPNKALGEPHE